MKPNIHHWTGSVLGHFVKFVRINNSITILFFLNYWENKDKSTCLNGKQSKMHLFQINFQKTLQLFIRFYKQNNRGMKYIFIAPCLVSFALIIRINFCAVDHSSRCFFPVLLSSVKGAQPVKSWVWATSARALLSYGTWFEPLPDRVSVKTIRFGTR